MLPTVDNKEGFIDSVLLTSVPRDLGDIVKSMKPGSHLLLLSAVKQHHLGTIEAEDNGLEIRDTIAYVLADGENDVAMKLISMARKPLEGTVAENVLEWGTGGLNIDESRVPGAPEPTRFNPAKHSHDGWRMSATGEECAANASPLGRWPANLLHCGSLTVQSMFPNSKTQRIEKPCPDPEITGHKWGSLQGNRGPRGYDGDGSAARFFYAAPSFDNLIDYLLKLTTPKNGTVFTNCNTDNLPKEYNYVTDCGY